VKTAIGINLFCVGLILKKMDKQRFIDVFSTWKKEMFSNSCPSIETRAVTDFSRGLKTIRDAISRRSRTLESLSREVIKSAILNDKY